MGFGGCSYGTRHISGKIAENLGTVRMLDQNAPMRKGWIFFYANIRSKHGPSGAVPQRDATVKPVAAGDAPPRSLPPLSGFPW